MKRYTREITEKELNLIYNNGKSIFNNQQKYAPEKSEAIRNKERFRCCENFNTLKEQTVDFLEYPVENKGCNEISLIPSRDKKSMNIDNPDIQEFYSQKKSPRVDHGDTNGVSTCKSMKEENNGRNIKTTHSSDTYNYKCFICNRPRQTFILTNDTLYPICHECNLSFASQFLEFKDKDIKIYINFMRILS